jgi:hypothetical protein
MCENCGCKVEEVNEEVVESSCECSEDDCCVEYCNDCECDCDEPVK